MIIAVLRNGKWQGREVKEDENVLDFIDTLCLQAIVNGAEIVEIDEEVEKPEDKARKN